MNCTELWAGACKLMREEINHVSYDTWISSSLKPYDVVDGCMLVECVNDMMINVVKTRYVAQIEDALFRSSGQAFTVEILMHDEIEKRLAEREQRTAEGDAGLNPRYTFDTFVVGNNNRFAHAVSLAVAEMPAKAYNPLFIYGGVGLGKTHLMQAVGHFVQQQYPELRLLYITSENFMNELITSMQAHRNQEFRNRFRSVDLLMVDDIQFIAGRDSTQEEFFHTFNALRDAGKQIIMTSDKPPKDIDKLEERLCSRFEGGLVADIQRPDIETRIAILRRKATDEKMMIPDDVLQTIADKIDSNIRELEGSLVRLTAYSTLKHRPVDQELAAEALRELFEQRETRALTCDAIQNAVTSYYGLPLGELKGAKRNREVAVPRQIAMYVAREMLPLSYPVIGAAFGGRDHTTVMYACKKVEESIKGTPGMATTIDDIRKMLREGK